MIEDLRAQKDGSRERQFSMFADFNGLPDEFEKRVDFYHWDQNWSNRMILGDSLMVMTSLAEKEGLKGQVQMIYMDPPYGIKFGSNWQVSTRKRDVKDGKAEDVNREPEVVKAFRDTWQKGIHSYLSYLRDRLAVAHELLTESGSVFVQIGDENLHVVRCVLDEVFGSKNFVALITVTKTTSATSELLAGTADYLLLYAKDIERVKYRQIYLDKQLGGQGTSGYSRVELPDGRRRSLTVEEAEDTGLLPAGSRIFTVDNLTSQRPPGDFPVEYQSATYRPARGYWKTHPQGMATLVRTGRVELVGNTLRYVRYLKDFSVFPLANVWDDTSVAGFASDKRYVVETSPKIVERCLLMTTDPGDLVLDPTCGSGTTAFVAEQWGRRWITIDTSRVALALARTRLLASRFAYYLLADSPEGVQKEREVTGKPPNGAGTAGDVKKGFVCRRVPHIMLKSIANNEEVEEIHGRYQQQLEPLRAELNRLLKQKLEGWQIPRNAGEDWSDNVKTAHEQWWRLRRERQGDFALASFLEIQHLTRYICIF